MTILLIAFLLTVAARVSAHPNNVALPNWSHLRNPVFEYRQRSVKDYAVAYRSGRFYLFFSAFYEDNGRIRSHVMEIATTDFTRYSKPVFNIDGEEDGWIGMCSPDVTEAGGVYTLTFNSWGDKKGQPNQLFYMQSRDLVNWSPRKPLAANLTNGVRAIDAAMAFENGKYYLLWKEGQVTRVCVSDSPDGDFRFIGDGHPKFAGQGDLTYEWNENYQMLKVGSRWFLIATSHRKSSSEPVPVIYEMKGKGNQETDWLTWVNGYQPELKLEAFNTDHRGNSAALLDMRSVDGFLYMLYAGRTDRQSYLNRGWNKLGLSRSKDMIHWAPAGSE